MLDFVETLNKSICKVRDPIVKLLTHQYKYTSYFSLPWRNQSWVWGVFSNNSVAESFNTFELLHVVFVLLIDVDKAFLLKHAFEAAIRVKLLTEENCWSVVVLAVNSESWVNSFVAIIHKLFINYSFWNVTGKVLWLSTIIWHLFY